MSSRLDARRAQNEQLFNAMRHRVPTRGKAKHSDSLGAAEIVSALRQCTRDATIAIITAAWKRICQWRSEYPESAGIHCRKGTGNVRQITRPELAERFATDSGSYLFNCGEMFLWTWDAALLTVTTDPDFAEQTEMIASIIAAADDSRAAYAEMTARIGGRSSDGIAYWAGKRMEYSARLARESSIAQFYLWTELMPAANIYAGFLELAVATQRTEGVETTLRILNNSKWLIEQLASVDPSTFTFLRKAMTDAGRGWFSYFAFDLIDETFLFSESAIRTIEQNLSSVEFEYRGGCPALSVRLAGSSQSAVCENADWVFEIYRSQLRKMKSDSR